jgi:hypothetical protein
MSSKLKFLLGDGRCVLLLAALVPCVAYSYLFGRVVFVFDILLLFALGWMQGGRTGWALHLAFVIVLAASILIGFNILPNYWGEYVAGLLHGNFEGGSFMSLGLVGLAYVLLPLFGRVRAGNRIRILAFGAFLVLLCIRLAIHGTSYSPALRTALGTFAVAAKQAVTAGVELHENQQASPEVFDRRLVRGEFDDQRNLMLFILESWGERPEMLVEIAHRLASLDPSIKIQHGYVSYRGSTIHGEIRSICGILSTPAQMTAESYQLCAPHVLARKGYRSYALHGYLPTYYGRDLIWKRMGFNQSLFSNSFSEAEFCGGAYHGVCDKVIVEKAFSLLREPGSKFIYALTLEGHEPVAREAMRKADKDMLFGDMSHDSNVQVVNRHLISQIHALYAAQPGTDTSVFIVGDHVPPSLREVSEYAKGKVPYLRLYR